MINHSKIKAMRKDIELVAVLSLVKNILSHIVEISKQGDLVQMFVGIYLLDYVLTNKLKPLNETIYNDFYIKFEKCKDNCLQNLPNDDEECKKILAIASKTAINLYAKLSD